MITQTYSQAAQTVSSSLLASQLDADGFLIETASWNLELAEQLARQAGIAELSAKHWQVINIVRHGFFSIGALPVMRLVCRAAGLDPSRAHELFSSCKSLWLIAGLPNPGEEVRSYMH